MNFFDVPISGLFFSSHDIRTYSLLVTSPGLFQCMWITHYDKGKEDHPLVSALVFVFAYPRVPFVVGLQCFFMLLIYLLTS